MKEMTVNKNLATSNSNSATEKKVTKSDTKWKSSYDIGKSKSTTKNGDFGKTENTRPDSI